MYEAGVCCYCAVVTPLSGVTGFCLFPFVEFPSFCSFLIVYITRLGFVLGVCVFLWGGMARSSARVRASGFPTFVSYML